MWEVIDTIEFSGQRSARATIGEAQASSQVVACLTSRWFRWDFVSAEPGRLVLRRNAYLREFKRLPDGSGKGK